jgi:citrate lyase subunit gamma (acyl carrier protein)
MYGTNPQEVNPMRITRESKAGSLESNDIMVIMKPIGENEGVKLEINSIVQNQYGDRIREVIMEVLNKYGITDTHVLAQDRGALDCTIKARVETAIRRGL